MTETFVIVGAGLTAGKAVEQLRESGFEGRIVVYGNERHLPYERPPLSKGYLLDNDPLDVVFVHGPEWYDENDVDLRLGTTVTRIDREARQVVAGDDTQPYDRLLLATGARPRHLGFVDDSGAPVAYLRTIEDSTRLKETFAAGQHIAIIGAGWIGLEAASAARQAGADVTVLETLELPLLRVLGTEVAKVFAGLHADHGVDLRTSVEVQSVEKNGDRAVVRLKDGAAIEADLVLVGIGVVPNTALAETAGLDLDNGVLVDEQLRTSDPAIFAAGDIANQAHPLLGRRLRVEHWDNAIEQGKAAARNMIGEQVPYDRLPYFFTDQYDLGMEYVGNVGPDGYDDVVLRGDPDGRVFTALWLQGGRVLAGMHVNDWDAIDPLRALVGSAIDGTRLRDESVALADLPKQ